MCSPRPEKKNGSMTSQLTDTAPPDPSPVPRILALDVVRGFALCGILLVNLPPLFNLDSVDAHGDPLAFYRFYEDFVQNRFFPIFSFLFGIGFGLMWLSASERSPRPRLALLRRFAFLGVLGVPPSAAAAGGGPAAVRHRRNRRAAALDLDPRVRFLTPVTTVLGGSPLG
jgi:uncharacterized protein